MGPVIESVAAYWRSVDQLEFALAGFPEDALPKCWQLVREKQNPQNVKESLLGTSSEVAAALKVAWAELKRLEE